LAPRIMMRLIYFWKICAPLAYFTFTYTNYCYINEYVIGQK
jgi:hypothetical protein